jgi:hypothetical protein
MNGGVGYQWLVWEMLINRCEDTVLYPEPTSNTYAKYHLTESPENQYEADNVCYEGTGSYGNPWIFKYSLTKVAAHEFGHVLGLGLHNNTIYPTKWDPPYYFPRAFDSCYNTSFCWDLSCSGFTRHWRLSPAFNPNNFLAYHLQSNTTLYKLTWQDTAALSPLCGTHPLGQYKGAGIKWELDPSGLYNESNTWYRHLSVMSVPDMDINGMSGEIANPSYLIYGRLEYLNDVGVGLAPNRSVAQCPSYTQLSQETGYGFTPTTVMK